MITEIGYTTRCHLLLNIQCVECGVWVAQEKIRFIALEENFELEMHCE